MSELSSSTIQPPLVPKDRRCLQVLGIARISTEHQDARSLEDQEALYRRFLNENSNLPYTLTMITGRGSGECLDRADYLRAWEEVETKQYDLVLAEDLARIARRAHAIQFCEHCEDHHTRLKALNDQIDTAQENWRLLASFASMRHEMYNADTSKRIRRSLRNRFGQGGVVQFVIYGYIKPPGTNSDSELQKDPAAEPVWDEIFNKLEEGASYQELADSLNARAVPTGPYCRSQKWTGKMLCRLVHNPILKGLRQRNRFMSRRVNSTGRRKAVKAPAAERQTRECPHLAFIEPERYDRVIALLAERNQDYRRKLVSGIDTRANVPKKRTVWPGQHLTCAVCGRMFHYGGHGITQRLVCSGAAAYVCWNAVTVDGPLAARKLLDAIRSEVSNLPDFDETLLEMIRGSVAQQSTDQRAQLENIQSKLRDLEREKDNLLRAIREGGYSKSLLTELGRIENEIGALQATQQRLTWEAPPELVLPDAKALRGRVAAAWERLPTSSDEFGRLIRRWIPQIAIFPVRLRDGGVAVPRAFLTLDLTSALAVGNLPGPVALLQRKLNVDLFEPPQREEYRLEVLRLAATGLKQREIASELGIHLPDVQRGIALQKRMNALGITDPYERITAPDAASRLRRHQHARFHFEPLPGFPLDALE